MPQAIVHQFPGSSIFANRLQASILALQDLSRLQEPIDAAARLLSRALSQDNKVLVCGNGGSAADAQHLAGELVGRFLKERKALPAIALNTDTAVLTCLGNDYGYEQVFARQVEALGRPGDVLVAISTSGESPNVVAAAQAAKQAGMETVGLLGRCGGQLAELVDAAVVAPATATPRIQEAHTFVLHYWAEVVEAGMAQGQG